MRRLSLWVLILLFGATAPAIAQDARPDVTVGYQFQRLSASGSEDVGGDVSESFPLGFMADVAVPVMGNLSVVGQLDWSRKTESETAYDMDFETTMGLTTFGGGIRWSSKTNPSMTPFVQALAGIAHSSASVTLDGEALEDIPSENNFMFQIGGGVAVPLNDTFSGVAQIDYRRIFTADAGTNSIRIVGGIRVKL